MSKRQRKQEIPAPPSTPVPEKPTKNGHYMGRQTGFEFEDGKYKIAPRHANAIDLICEEKRGIAAWMELQNNYMTQRYKSIAEAERLWWKTVTEDLGINGDFRYSNGWLIPFPVEQQAFSCIYCGLQNFIGKDAVIAHHGVCPKNPWLKKG